VNLKITYQTCSTFVITLRAKILDGYDRDAYNGFHKIELRLQEIS